MISYKRSVRIVLSAVLRTVLRVQVKGVPHALARPGPLIVTSNHLSYLDGPLIALCAGHFMHYAVEPQSALHNPRTRAVLRLLEFLGYGKVVPLDSNSPHSLRTLAKLLRAGEKVMLFPEGHISRDGRPQPEQPGVMWLQRLSNSPRYDLLISGADKSKLFGKSGRHIWPKITVHFE